MPFVLDCSVALTWVFPEEANDKLDALCDSLVHDYALVPELWPLEIVNVLLFAQRKGKIDAADIPAVVSRLQSLSIQMDRETGAQAFSRTLSLAQKHNLTSYDAAYLELAQRESLPLATLDKALRTACRAEGVEVI